MDMKHILAVPRILLLIFVVYQVQTQNTNEKYVDSVMNEYDIDGLIVPGASVLVNCCKKTLIRRSYGFSNIEKNVRVTPVTNFRLASVTKQFTAAAVLLLIEESNDKIKLDDFIRRKWFPALPQVTDLITIRHLLTHTSGLIDYEDVPMLHDDPNYQLLDADVLKILVSQNQTYFTPPGSQYRYSNSGYALLALIVEQVSGQSFANFLNQRIFLQLEMHNTIAYEAATSTVENRAFGYSINGSTWIRTDQSKTSAVLGDGGIYSSIDDLSKWDVALHENRLLSFELLEQIFKPAVATDQPDVYYGFGWYIKEDMVWHEGTTIGFRNVIIRFPKRKLTIVILTNRNSPAPYQKALMIAGYFFNTTQCNGSNSLYVTFNERVNYFYICFIMIVYAHTRI